MTVTQTAALQSIRDRLDETVSAAMWTDAQLLRYLNEGLRETSREGKCLRDEQGIATVANTPTVTAPATMVEVAGSALYWTDVSNVPATALVNYTARHRLMYRDRQALDLEWGSNQATSGTPYYWTMWGGATQLSLQAGQQIRFYPTPSVAGCLIVPFYRLATELATDGSDGSDPLDLPNGWEDCAVDWACYRALLQSRDATFAGIYFQDFQRHLAELQNTSARYADAPGEITMDPLGAMDYGGFGF